MELKRRLRNQLSLIKHLQRILKDKVRIALIALAHFFQGLLTPALSQYPQHMQAVTYIFISSLQQSFLFVASDFDPPGKVMRSNVYFFSSITIRSTFVFSTFCASRSFSSRNINEPTFTSISWVLPLNRIRRPADTKQTRYRKP